MWLVEDAQIPTHRVLTEMESRNSPFRGRDSFPSFVVPSGKEDKMDWQCELLGQE